MSESTRNALIEFLNGIPEIKRRLNPDINQPNDFKRLVKVSIALLENDDILDVGDLKFICEEIAGEGYSYLVNDPKFTTDFEMKIISKINSTKHVIEIYQEIAAKK